MAQIIPAILEQTLEGFVDKVSRVVKISGVHRIQVDFSDGTFVPNTMLSVSEIHALNPAFHWEAHLMCKAPKDFLDYQISGFKTIIVHFEAYEHITDLSLALQTIQSQGSESVVCINPETEVGVLAELSLQVKHFQIMGVHPGFQGAGFLPETVARVAKLRELCPNAILSVDGGVNETNIKQLSEAGADLVVVGSALTKAPDMQQAYELLIKTMTG